ncbi:hypothetical protein HAX54_042035, partial [Datura stramonium]|nr:hypothetical protein [Datura stramonium]
VEWMPGEENQGMIDEVLMDCWSKGARHLYTMRCAQHEGRAENNRRIAGGTPISIREPPTKLRLSTSAHGSFEHI